MILSEFLEQYQIKIYFQPIISTLSKQIIGYEALTRGFTKDKAISPIALFQEAKEHDLTFLFDKYVRALAIKKFTTYYQANPNLLLFLNFESSLIDRDFKFEEFDFYTICQDENILPSNIVLEIREDTINNSENLEKFSAYYKNKGFNIALDDFGMGGSTFDRLSLVKPDIVKIDRSLICDIDKNFINSEILKAITKMCSKIGAIVLAEGVEKDGEILKCLKTDISIYQGFFFARPDEFIENQTQQINKNILEISILNEKMIKEHKEKKEKLFYQTHVYSQYVIDELVKLNPNDFSAQSVKEFLNNELKLEAIYLIDFYTAKQIGETIISGEIRKFFSPAKHGDSHYLKEYYNQTKSSKDNTFLSQKYISHATGSMCRTFAKRFNHNEMEYILCLDILI